MAAKQAGVRAQAVEVFAAAIPPRGRGGRGAGFCLRARHRSDALGGVLADAATLAPAAVIVVLGGLLPRLDPRRAASARC